ncbi:mucin-5AC-like [Notolabrus celidotus]|uniref:mucin-5AC-like n=1 Tax=Notolabrus celidotus TaxID=1203425 RepID=UPI00148FB8B7|nr:mucin-5AC-like [Notolabrus celidotus]
MSGPGSVMMACVWVSLLALVQLSAGQEPHRDADGGPAGVEPLLSDSEPPEETRGGGVFLPVPVWRFVKGGGQVSDDGRPQYRCSDRTLSVRFSLIRHAHLQLEENGKRLLALPDGCRGSVRIFGPWLLLKLPYTSCHIASWVSNGTEFLQLKLRYFDHLLQRNVTAEAACENPSVSSHLSPPMVRCRSTDVDVKLPLGTRLKRVKALGKDGVIRRALTTTTRGAALVQISTPADLDSTFEIIYVDSSGEMSTMLAACFNAATQSQRDRHLRSVQNPDLWELWEFEEIPLESYKPEQTQPSKTEPTEPPISEPSIPEPLFPEPFFPESLFPEPLFPEPLFPEPLFPESLFPEPLFPEQLFPEIVPTQPSIPVPTEPSIPVPTTPSIPVPTEPSVLVPTEPLTTAPLIPETTEGEQGTPPTVVTTTKTTWVPFSDAEIFELWGFDEIPTEPYTGDPTTTALPITSTAALTTSTATTSASSITTRATTTSATTTSATTTSATTTTTTSAPSFTTSATTTSATTTSATTTTTTSATTTTTTSAPSITTSATTTSAAPTTTTSGSSSSTPGAVPSTTTSATTTSTAPTPTTSAAPTTTTSNPTTTVVAPTTSLGPVTTTAGVASSTTVPSAFSTTSTTTISSTTT